MKTLFAHLQFSDRIVARELERERETQFLSRLDWHEAVVPPFIPQWVPRPNYLVGDKPKPFSSLSSSSSSSHLFRAIF